MDNTFKEIQKSYIEMYENIGAISSGDFGSANPKAPLGAMSSDINHFVWAVAKKSNPKIFKRYKDKKDFLEFVNKNQNDWCFIKLPKEVK